MCASDLKLLHGSLQLVGQVHQVGDDAGCFLAAGGDGLAADLDAAHGVHHLLGGGALLLGI
jgi:hypothetical protein